MQKIPLYLDDQLDAADTKKLLRHLKDCRECMDEMEINYLLREGLRRVESGETLNLENELQKKLQHSEDELELLDQIHSGVMIIEGTAVFMLAACLLLMFL